MFKSAVVYFWVQESPTLFCWHSSSIPAILAVYQWSLGPWGRRHLSLLPYLVLHGHSANWEIHKTVHKSIKAGTRTCQRNTNGKEAVRARGENHQCGPLVQSGHCPLYLPHSSMWFPPKPILRPWPPLHTCEMAHWSLTYSPPPPAPLHSPSYRSVLRLHKTCSVYSKTKQTSKDTMKRIKWPSLLEQIITAKIQKTNIGHLLEWDSGPQERGHK